MFSVKKNKMGVDVHHPVNPRSRTIDETNEGKYLFGRANILWPVECKMLFHVTNEGKRSKRVASDLQQAGLRPGVSDYILLRPSKRYAFLVIELKRETDSYATKDQSQFILDAIKNGGYGCVCNGADAALHVIEKYLNNFTF